jgi:hypothetical protein
VILTEEQVRGEYHSRPLHTHLHKVSNDKIDLPTVVDSSEGKQLLVADSVDSLFDYFNSNRPAAYLHCCLYDNHAVAAAHVQELIFGGKERDDVLINVHH